MSIVKQKQHNIIQCDRCGVNFTRLTSLRTHEKKEKYLRTIFRLPSLELIKKNIKLERDVISVKIVPYKSAVGKCYKKVFSKSNYY